MNQQNSQSARRTRSLTGQGEANCELCAGSTLFSGSVIR